MNLNKFTEKSVQAIQDAQNIAQEYGNPELTQQHILLALVRAKGLITQLIIKLGCSEQKVEADAAAAVPALAAKIEPGWILVSTPRTAHNFTSHL